MSKVKSCPICGADTVKEVAHTAKAQLTLGKEFEYQQYTHCCDTCGESWEPEDDSKLDSYEKALKHSQTELVEQLAEQLKAQGISMSHFERSFELPFRTVARWKQGQFSAAVLALLRTAVTFPFLVDVADNRFDPKYATVAVFKEGMNAAERVLEQSNLSLSHEITVAPGEAISGTYQVFSNEQGASNFELAANDNSDGGVTEVRLRTNG